MNAPQPRELDGEYVDVISEMAPRVAPDPAAAPLARPAPAPQIPQQANATSLLSAITAAASNPNVDIDKMERLFAMHREMVMWEAEAAFNTALARAQARIEPIAWDRDNDFTKSRYSTLRAINREITPIYTAEGLSLTFDTETVNADDPIPKGWLRTVAWLAHASGHKKRYHLDLPPDIAGSGGKVNKTEVQASGSTNEYARRYLARMIFNLATGDDTDGNSDRDDRGGQQKKQQQEEKPAYTNEAINANLAGWTKLVAAGKKPPDRILAQLKLRFTLTPEQEKRINAALEASLPKTQPTEAAQ